MSKSEESPQGTIEVLDDPSQITKKIKSAVTDSETDVRHDRDTKAGVSNLIEIFAAVTGQTIPVVEGRFGAGGYGAFKSAVADAVVEYLRPVQARYAELVADPGEVDRLVAAGAEVAASVADPVLARGVGRGGAIAPRVNERSGQVPAGRSVHGVGRARLVGHPAAEGTSPRSLPARRSRLTVPSALGACSTASWPLHQMKFIPSPNPALGSSSIAVSDMSG